MSLRNLHLVVHGRGAVQGARSDVAGVVDGEEHVVCVLCQARDPALESGDVAGVARVPDGLTAHLCVLHLVIFRSLRPLFGPFFARLFVGGPVRELTLSSAVEYRVAMSEWACKREGVW